MPIGRSTSRVARDAPKAKPPGRQPAKKRTAATKKPVSAVNKPKPPGRTTHAVRVATDTQTTSTARAKTPTARAGTKKPKGNNLPKVAGMPRAAGVGGITRTPSNTMKPVLNRILNHPRFADNRDMDEIYRVESISSRLDEKFGNYAAWTGYRHPVARAMGKYLNRYDNYIPPGRKRPGPSKKDFSVNMPIKNIENAGLSKAQKDYAYRLLSAGLVDNADPAVAIAKKRIRSR